MGDGCVSSGNAAARKYAKMFPRYWVNYGLGPLLHPGTWSNCRRRVFQNTKVTAAWTLIAWAPPGACVNSIWAPHSAKSMSCDVSVTATFKTTFVSFLVEMSVPGEGETGFTNGKMSDERRRGTREFPVLTSDLCCSIKRLFYEDFQTLLCNQ